MSDDEVISIGGRLAANASRAITVVFLDGREFRATASGARACAAAVIPPGCTGEGVSC
jgi:hypothetical protein